MKLKDHKKSDTGVSNKFFGSMDLDQNEKEEETLMQLQSNKSNHFRKESQFKIDTVTEPAKIMKENESNQDIAPAMDISR